MYRRVGVDVVGSVLSTADRLRVTFHDDLLVSVQSDRYQALCEGFGVEQAHFGLDVPNLGLVAVLLRDGHAGPADLKDGFRRRILDGLDLLDRDDRHGTLLQAA